MAYKSKYVYVDCTLEWAKLREEDRDMGPEDGSDMAKNFEDKQGVYVVNCYIDEGTRVKMIKDGIPDKGLQAQLFKTDKEGRVYYKATSPHFNPKFVDQETGEQGVIIGPPEVFDGEGDALTPWDWKSKGLIGNGTKAIVKFSVWDGKITTLQAIKVTDHVVYEREEVGAF